MHHLFGNRFAEAQGNGRHRAWHNLGETFTEYHTAEAALAKAGMLYKLGKFPLAVDLTPRDPKTGEPKISPRNGKAVPLQMTAVPNQWAIVRERVTEDPEPRVLGYVGKDYQIMQNRDVARLIDRYAKKWHVETVGALGQGETIFFSMATGAFEVAGDEIEQYVVVSDTRDGTGGQTWMATCVRVVCENTLAWGLESATSKVTLTHGQALVAEAGEMAAIFSQLDEIQTQARRDLARLVEIPVLPALAETALEAIYEEPAMPAKVKLALAVDGAVETPHLLKGKAGWEMAKANVLDWRKSVRELFDVFNDSFPESAQTGYALYNAVTEFEDHVHKGRTGRSRAESAVFGDRARTKSRAFDLISGLG